MSDPLRTVLVRRPDTSFAVSDPNRWGYAAKPDLAAAQKEHDGLVDLVKQSGIEVLYHAGPQPGKADSVFVHDPAIVTDRGALILRMGKELRRGEEASMARAFGSIGVPVLATLDNDATAEGGDLLWVNHDTLAVGQGFRTNAEGLRQIREATNALGVEVVPVPLPYFQGPEACLHLMSLVSLWTTTSRSSIRVSSRSRSGSSSGNTGSISSRSLTRNSRRWRRTCSQSRRAIASCSKGIRSRKRD